MGTLIDSSILVAAERTRVGAQSLLLAHLDEEIAIAAVTASELLHGVHRAVTPGQRARREAFVEAFLSAVPVVPFDLLVARVHARLWADLAAKGSPVGDHDLQIGATALAIGFDVATRDQRSFPKMAGLRVVTWDLPAPPVKRDSRKPR